MDSLRFRGNVGSISHLFKSVNTLNIKGLKMTLIVLVYLVGLVSKLDLFLNNNPVLYFLMVILMLFLAVICYVKKDGYDLVIDYKTSKKPFLISLWVFISLIILSIIVPTERTVYIMLGVYAAQEIVESKTFEKIKDNTNVIGDKTITLINKKLDKYIAEESTKL